MKSRMEPIGGRKGETTGRRGARKEDGVNIMKYIICKHKNFIIKPPIL
jgi:hypothetical protein